MIFGNEKLFAFNCVKKESLENNFLIAGSIFVVGRELGNSTDFCPAGIILHSADIFLSNRANRDQRCIDPRQTYEHLYETSYGERWREGVEGRHRARFSVGEIFEISVSDYDWIIFLVNSECKSHLLVGNRGDGYLFEVLVDINYVEDNLFKMLAWIKDCG